MIAAQVDEALEGFLFAAGEEPIVWAIYVGLEVLLGEPAGQVAAERVPLGFALLGVNVVGQSARAACARPQSHGSPCRQKLGSWPNSSLPDLDALAAVEGGFELSVERAEEGVDVGFGLEEGGGDEVGRAKRVAGRGRGPGRGGRGSP